MLAQMTRGIDRLPQPFFFPAVRVRRGQENPPPHRQDPLDFLKAGINVPRIKMLDKFAHKHGIKLTIRKAHPCDISAMSPGIDRGKLGQSFFTAIKTMKLKVRSQALNFSSPHAGTTAQIQDLMALGREVPGKLLVSLHRKIVAFRACLLFVYFSVRKFHQSYLALRAN